MTISIISIFNITIQLSCGAYSHLASTPSAMERPGDFFFFFVCLLGGRGRGCGRAFFLWAELFFSGVWAGAYAFCCLGRGMVWVLNSKNKATAQTPKNHARPPKQQKQHPNRPNNKKDQTATKNNVYLASTTADCQAGGGSQLQIRPRRSGFLVWGLGFIKAYTTRGILRSF